LKNNVIKRGAPTPGPNQTLDSTVLKLDFISF